MRKQHPPSVDEETADLEMTLGIEELGEQQLGESADLTAPRDRSPEDAAINYVYSLSSASPLSPDGGEGHHSKATQCSQRFVSAFG